ncbi:MAG: TonB-dependent receptor, partial [Bacteroidota bacterium]
IPSVRVGGPYTITVSFIGYNNFEVKDVNLQLGETYSINANMTDSSVALEDVVVVAEKNAVFDKRRTGSAVNITSKTIKEIPTISRSQGDLTKLTPSSDGNSFGGRNNQYNSFSLDGSIFNNPFGLDAATPGGQTSAQPISLDAIEQVQVAIAPYDVTQAGFTGAAVNAVTKSGTNEFKGTVYGFYRNQNMTGNKVGGVEIDRADLNQFQSGLSVGGPLIKNKLFFFANFEVEQRQDLGSPMKANRGEAVEGNISRISAADMDAVSDALYNAYDYETGAYEGYMHDTKNTKGIVKIDWNISDQHTLSAKYNWLDASQDKNAHPNAIIQRGPNRNTLQFENSGYQINNQINSGIIELNSRWENASNKLMAGYTKFHDFRNPFSDPFPVINILQAGTNGIVAGHEPFSINNVLNQEVYQFTDNFNYYLGNHVITAGVSFEKFKFANSFNLVAYENWFNPDLIPYGSPYYGTFSPWFDQEDGTRAVDNFINAVNAGAFDANVQNAKDVNAAANWSWAYTNVGQFATYIQDKWSVNENFTLTAGLRIDMPLYFDTSENITPNTDDITYFDPEGNPIKFDNTKLPNQKPLFSPRFGFNWDVTGDKRTQIRGGSGLFTGRLPFVWIGNQVQNTGTGYFNVTNPNFEFPQVWRTNLGVDHNFGQGWIVEADVLYTKDMNAAMVRNYALGTPSGNLKGVGDTRPVYVGDDVVRYDDGFGGTPVANAYIFDNVSEGYSFNFSATVKKSFENGLYTSLGYNYLDAKDVSSISAEISGDAFDRNPISGNSNNPVLAPSMYGNKHRFVMVAAKTVEWNEKWVSTFSLVGDIAKGGRYSYTYSGDLNGDTSPLNDLIYIPTETELQNMQFSDYTDYLGNTVAAASQKDAFEAFINQDEYLSANRGNIAEKYAILSPWYSKFDFRFMQDFNFKVGSRTNTIQFTWDILNVGNLLNSNWGVYQLPVNTQPLGVTVDSDQIPSYTFDVEQKSTFVDDFSLMSRWQMQFGIRYIF